MKRLSLLIVLAFIVSCKTKNVITDATLENFKKKKDNTVITVNPEVVEKAKIARAENLGLRVLKACNTSKFKVFTTEEATEKLIQKLTLEKISADCQKINFRNGKFLASQLQDISYNQNTDQYIFRYALEYEKDMYKRELFVILDSDNRVSSIFTKELKNKPM
jgi:hypothetical protein